MRVETQEQYDLMEAYLVGQDYGWHANGKEQTFEGLPEQFKFGPLAAEFAEGYRNGLELARGAQ